ncbi:MAG: hypothetical protein EP330_23265 [Deltaproteobacteria bacterium]|nr:MAG: hypothetical protein EP330_23265 [Deltaproteobacteria bacterium]
MADWTRRGLLVSSALGVLAVSLGCTRRARIPAMARAGLRGERYLVEVHLLSGQAVTGWVYDYRNDTAELVILTRSKEERPIALADIDYIRYHDDEIRGDRVEFERALALVFGTLVGIPVVAALVFLIVLAIVSCPFVYVVDPVTGERRRVGEAYAGAIVRALARKDVMALPELGTGRVELVLTNEAHETQYTDVAELWWVEHAPQERVVVTHDGRLLSLGNSVAPRAVEDLDGVDQRDKLGHDEVDRAWATQLLDALKQDPRPTREGLVASFEAAPDRAVLEVVVRTSPWLDRLSLLGWASLGQGRVERVQAQGRDPETAGRARELMERGGVHTLVEVRQRGGWKEVARLPQVGWVAQRRLAVPLDVAAGEPLEVRISGGVGFLIVYDLRLASSRGEVTPQVAAPGSATQSTGDDERGRLAAVDGDPNVLDAMLEECSLVFELPELPEGKVRSHFLHTHGYYEVHPPEYLDVPPVARKAMRDPENFGAYGLEVFETLYNEHLAVREEAS